MMEKLFHHDKKSHEQSDPAQSASEQEPTKRSELEKIKAEIKKDEQKFKDYVEKDEAMEREGNGNEYGGLM